MIQKIKSYITFLLKSSNEHGVHSPFVFDLVTQCFYAKTNPDLKKSFLTYRNELTLNKKKVFITDFGAGSNYFKSNERIVSEIVKNVGISTKRALLLIRLVQYMKPKKILEIGTSVGLSTYCFKLGNALSIIETLEGCSETSKVAKTQFEKFNFFPTLTIGNFTKSIPIALQNKTYDFIYIDGNHQKEATILYFKQCLKSIHNNSIIIFDDIHWSKGMEEAWELIQKDPNVTVSIDTYQWGIIFFRKEQKKEHFIIRI